MLQQFILFYEILLSQEYGAGLFAGLTEEKLLEEQLRALRMTAPGIDLEEVNKSLLTIQEIMILDSIANLYWKLEKKRETLYLYEQLLRYTQKHCLLMQDAARIIPIITHNYANKLLCMNNFEEGCEIAELGCEFCVRYGRTKLLGQLLYFKAYSLLEMKKRDRYNEAIDNLRQAYHVLRVFRNDGIASQIAEEAIEKWGIELD